MLISYLKNETEVGLSILGYPVAIFCISEKHLHISYTLHEKKYHKKYFFYRFGFNRKYLNIPHNLDTPLNFLLPVYKLKQSKIANNKI